MDFKTSKCGFHPIYEGCCDTPILYGKEPIPGLYGSDVYKYLGVNFGRKINTTPTKVIEDLRKIVSKIDSSLLLPWQKINCFQTFGHSKLLFAFRTSFFHFKSFSGTMVTNKKTGHVSTGGVDIQVRSMLKRCLNLQATATNEYLYTATDFGGMGIISCADECAVQKVVQGYRILTCNHSLVSNIAKEMLKSLYLKHNTDGHLLSQSEQMQRAINWLNTNDIGRKSDSPWYWFKDAIDYLNKELKISVRIELQNSIIVLKISHKLYDEVELINITPKDKHMVCPTLHNLLGKAHFVKFRSMEWHNQLWQSFPMMKGSTKAIKRGDNLSAKEWYFIHPAKINSLPVNYKPYIRANRSIYCRKGCRYADGRQQFETQAHVLCHCIASKDIVTDRHNAVMKYLVKAIREHTSHKVLIEERCSLTTSTFLIDLQIFDYAKRILFLVDVKTPYDLLSNIEETCVRNVTKYTSIKLECEEKLAESNAFWTVHLLTFAVGALGTWHTSCIETLKLMGMHDNVINKIGSKITLICIKGAYKAWCHHQRILHNDDVPSILTITT